MHSVTKKDPYYRSIEFYVPYVVTRPSTLEHLDLNPMGINVAQEDVHDPLTLGSASFIQLIYNLHKQVCGPFGMVMEKWVGFDCGFFPGVVFGFGRPASGLSLAYRNGLQIPDDYEGLVPFSVGIAIPTLDRATWEIHSLGSLNQVAPGAGPPGLNRLTLAYGTGVLRAEQVMGILRWRSHLMGVFAALGPISILTAWTPGHDYPTTITGKVTANDDARARALRATDVSHASVDSYIDADDLDAMQELQRDLEQGLGVDIVGPAEDFGTMVRHPLKFDGTPRHFVGYTDPTARAKEKIRP